MDWNIENGRQTLVVTDAGDSVVVSTVYLGDVYGIIGYSYETMVFEADPETGSVLDYFEYDAMRYTNPEEAFKNHKLYVSKWRSENRKLEDIER